MGTSKKVFNNDIVKHNKLIETSYKLTKMEQLFVLLLIAQINSEDTVFKAYSLSFTDIQNILNFDGKRRITKKEEVFELIRSLNTKPIYYENEQIEGQSVWISTVERDKKNDTFTFRFSDNLQPYLLHLKEQFTQYNLQNIVYLNGHAIRIYEILKRYEYLGHCVLKVEQLKFYLGLDNAYDKFYEFKRCVLMPAQKALTQFTDITFDYKTVEKEGKKVISLRFDITSNIPTEQPVQAKYISQKFQEVANGEANIYAKIEQKHQSKINELTESQANAYEFLADKSVNRSFILEHVLAHPKLKYEDIKGHEDIYIRLVWNFFETKSTASKKGGAFVSWWKKDKLTNDHAHVAFLEQLQKKKKQLSAQEQEDRAMSKTMNAASFGEWKDYEKQREQNNSLQKNRAADKNHFASLLQSVAQAVKPEALVFDLSTFIEKNPNVYTQAKEKAKELTQQFAKDNGIEIPENQLGILIKNRTQMICEACQEQWQLGNKTYLPSDYRPE